MMKIFKITIGIFFIIFCIDNINCKKEGKLNKNHVSSTESPSSSDLNLVSFDGADAAIEDIFHSKQSIKFGENNIVTVYESSEILHENGTVTTKLLLDNGIFLNINAIPNEENGTTVYSLLGSIEFGTPDYYLYFVEFNAAPDSFKIIQYERKPKIGLRANAKYLAALSG